MKKLPIVPIIIVVVVLLIIGGVVFAQKMNSSGPKATPTPTPEESTIERIPVDSLEVVFDPRYDNKAFTLTIKGLKEKDFKSFEYEISYDAQSSEEPGQIITQGSASREPILVTSEDFEREILLGTCSKNVCKYDKGIEKVKVTLRLTETSEKIKIWENEFTLE